MSDFNTTKLNNEKILIGACFTLPDVLIEIISRVDPECFSNATLREIYKVILDMRSKGIEINRNSLGPAIANYKIISDDKIEEVLDDCEYAIPNCDLTDIINSVIDDALLRDYRNKLEQIIKKIDKEPIKDICEFVSGTESELQAISNKRRYSDFKTSKEIVPMLMERLQDQLMHQRNNKLPSYLTGIPTGYENLDRIIGGLRKGEVIIIGARPGVGKTAFIVNIMYNVARSTVGNKGKKNAVALFEMEMDATSVMKRFLALASRLEYKEIDSLQFTYHDKTLVYDEENTDTDQYAIFKSFQHASKELSNLDIFIDDSSTQRIPDLEQKCIKLKERNPNLSLVVIDYLGLIASTGRNIDNRAQEVGEMSRALKKLARTIECPIICLSQLSRSSEKRTNHKPMLADLRESGSIEQDADIVMFLYREDYYKNQGGDSKPAGNDSPTYDDSVSETILSIQKNRSGSIGDIKFSFDKAMSLFSALEEEGIGEE